MVKKGRKHNHKKSKKWISCDYDQIETLKSLIREVDEETINEKFLIQKLEKLLKEYKKHLYFRGVGERRRRSYKEERTTQYLRHISRVLYAETCDHLEEVYESCSRLEECFYLVEVQLMLVEIQPHTATCTQNSGPISSQYDSERYEYSPQQHAQKLVSSELKLYVAFNTRYRRNDKNEENNEDIEQVTKGKSVFIIVILSFEAIKLIVA